MRTTITEALRGLSAAGVLLSGVVHLDVWFSGVRDFSVLGPLFLLNFAGGMVIGVGMLAWRHWLPAFLAAGYAATTLVFFYISVVHGLFGVQESLGGWQEVMAQVSELAALAFGLSVVAISATVRWPRRGPSLPSAARQRLTSAPRSPR
ncbi:MAG TPA: hypothetical protein VFR99_05020 [Marmoricola sp.]|nr:hypothetical protein [Marmoricola sp.]